MNIQLKQFKIQFDNQLILAGDFTATKGEITGIVGESGSGKTSLLNVLSLMSYDQSFDYFMDLDNLRNNSKNSLKDWQKQKIAYILQQPQFIDSVSCLENVELECSIAGVSHTKKYYQNLFKKLDLNGKDKVKPTKLSGGEKQRLAIACAIAKNADIILCDEITSSLDNENTHKMMLMLQELAHQEKKTIILSSHEQAVIDYCDDVYEIQNQTLVKIKTNEQYETTTKEKKVQFKQLNSRKYQLKLALARTNKKWALFLLLLVVGALTSSILAYTSVWSMKTLEKAQKQVDRVLVHELFVVNGKDEHSYKTYLLPFEENIEDELLAVDGVGTIYPFYYFSSLMRNENNKYEDSIIEVKKNGEVINTYEMIVNNPDPVLKPGINTISPYYEEQNILETCDQTTSVTDGIILDWATARDLGIEKLEEGMSVALDIGIVVGGTPTTYGFIHVDSENVETRGEKAGLTEVYETIRVEFPISAILGDYKDPNSGADFYLPYDIFMDYIKQGIAMHEYQEDEVMVAPAAYKIFLSDPSKREEVVSDVKNISDDLFIEDQLPYLKELEIVANNMVKYLCMVMGLIFGVAVILLLLYGVLHKKDVYKDELYYKVHGIDNEFNIVTGIELMCVWLGITVVSVVSVGYLLVYGIPQYPLWAFGNVGNVQQTVRVTIALLNVVYCFIAATITQLPLLRNKK